MSKVVVVVPTYNEKRNLPILTEQLLALPIPGLEVLVVDDNSPDGTGQVADELSTSSGGRVKVLHRAGKQGLGTAYVQGFKKAIAEGAEVVVQMDADFSHDPKYVPQLVETLNQADVVIGSRYTKGGKLDEQWSMGRRLLSWWANSVWVRTILHSPVHDSTAGFRAWKRQTLLGMNLDRIKSNGYIFQVEMTYIALRLGYHFHEIPIYFADRKYDKSKMGLKIQIEAALGVLQVWSRYRNLTTADRAPEH